MYIYIRLYVYYHKYNNIVTKLHASKIEMKVSDTLKLIYTSLNDSQSAKKRIKCAKIDDS